MRIGIGFDVHRLVSNRRLVLGGVVIPHYKGLDGHSDADVLVHAVMDALLGAVAAGDIGHHFPDTDDAYKDADSLKLLEEVMGLVEKKEMQIVNMDAVIMAEKPKLASYLGEIQGKLCEALSIHCHQLNIKATTTEKIGFVGREEGIAAQVVVLLQKK